MIKTLTIYIYIDYRYNYFTNSSMKIVDTVVNKIMDRTTLLHNVVSQYNGLM